ncbi:MAG: EscU/YscU/HrcU family type III secretion system export apparatus switch protein [Ignavibacteria bacterium]
MSQFKSKYVKGAVAIGYKVDQEPAPKIIAKGQGELAKKIINIAIENNILIQEDPLLFESLCRLEVGDEIPAKLYHVVAELLAYVYKVNKKKKRSYI